eukprot:TRINITY_DN3728_c0_g1_i2.p3 TRINITY_DN3728_c0_g1~~TRINITY_DN3728_c0_g1_i2.p3  ORF type:complete len:104 (+),score=22.86 TRINITY_DN3728_c0_g1_i2:592-903(+)
MQQHDQQHHHRHNEQPQSHKCQHEIIIATPKVPQAPKQPACFNGNLLPPAPSPKLPAAPKQNGSFAPKAFSSIPKAPKQSFEREQGLSLSSLPPSPSLPAAPD